MTVLRNLAFYAVCVFVFFIPAESITVLQGFGTIGKLAGVIAFGIGLGAVLYTEIRQPVSAYLIMVVVFIGWGFLSYWWSIDQQATLRILITLAQILLMVALLREFGAAPQAPLWLMQAYVLGAGLAAGATIQHYLEATTRTARFAAFDINANALALILLLAIPMAWYLSMHTRRWYAVWGNRILVLLAIFAILLTGSRSGALAMVIAFSFIPLSVRRIAWGQKMFWITVLLVGLGVAWTLLPQRTALRLLGGQEEVSAMLEGDPNAGSYRVGVWLSGLDAFAERPVMGSGVGAFQEAMEPYYALYSNPYEGAKASHNTFLAVLVEQGVVGMILYAWLLAWLVYQTRTMGATERLLCLVLLLSWAASNMFINQLEEKHTWFLFTLITLCHPGVLWGSRGFGIVRPS